MIPATVGPDPPAEDEPEDGVEKIHSCRGHSAGESLIRKELLASFQTLWSIYAVSGRSFPDVEHLFQDGDPGLEPNKSMEKGVSQSKSEKPVFWFH